ncbi:ankyrin repeat domain-containing protein 27-like isoform X2 [Zophobas morio]|uniref:ankyrin repeat domain-containing protein 27-like isoform X2 n=1 Tax=Zophobas morio TaxID=2755281 RepID=UPI003083932C
MDIKDLKHAEQLLIKTTQNQDIKDLIETQLSTWVFPELSDRLAVATIKNLFYDLCKEIFHDDQSDNKVEALQWLVFDQIHDICLTYIRARFSDQDKAFFEKCRTLLGINVSAEQFGANENYSIPLSAAIVELSVLDNYKTPGEKMNCLCTTYDLVFAEIKTAMVAVISQNSEKENEIPVIDNRDILPVLMVVIIKSKLSHVFSNLFYVKSFYHTMDDNRVISDIFRSFEKAVHEVAKTDTRDVQPGAAKMIQSIDLEEYMKITLSDEDQSRRTLVDEANHRALNLITKSTVDHDSV